MFLRAGQQLLRFSGAKNVAQQTKRNLYPFSNKYMAVYLPGGKPTPAYEKVCVYVAFMIGIFGPPMFIMYDVGRKRPDRK